MTMYDSHDVQPLWVTEGTTNFRRAGGADASTDVREQRDRNELCGEADLDAESGQDKRDVAIKQLTWLRSAD